MCFKPFSQSIRWGCRGLVPEKEPHASLRPGRAKRCSLGPAPGAISITLCSSRSKFLFKPHLQPLGSAFIIHLNSTSLVRERGWFVLRRWISSCRLPGGTRTSSSGGPSLEPGCCRDPQQNTDVPRAHPGISGVPAGAGARTATVQSGDLPKGEGARVNVL